MAVIAIEEHFTSPQLRKLIAPREGPIQAMLDNASTRLIKDMDEGGIDIAVLSENNPAAHNLDPETSVTMAKASNDFLHAQIQANPTRFKGFAALPLPDPKAAADELERGVTKLGLLGAMIMGTTKGQFVDDKKFWPVFERATKLDVPVYIHPSRSRRGVLQGSRRRVAGLAARLWPRDVDAHVPADHLRPVRPVSDPEDHRRTSRRDGAVHVVAHRAQS
jgi:2,3-dihydroxybenzoate decarboxylase